MKYLRQTLIAFLLTAPLAVKADLWTDLKLNDFGSTTGLIGSAPGEAEVLIETRVARLINALLSFMGMLFTILIIYGGVRWMTARGNSQQVDEAKSVVKNATIGLAIVLFAYVIARLVVTILEGREVATA